MRIPEGSMIYGEADASIVLVQMVDSHDLEGIESEVDGSTDIHRDDRDLDMRNGWKERISSCSQPITA